MAAVLSFIPLSMFFYWLAYALHGKGDAVYYELGRIAEYAITSFIGVVTAALFLFATAVFRGRFNVRLYFGLVVTLFLGYLAFSFLDCYTTLT